MQNITTCLSQATVGNTTIKLPMYNCKVVIKIVDNVKLEAEKLYKKNKIKEEFDGEAEGALLTINIDSYYLLLGHKFLTHNTIAHEVFHAAMGVAEDRGIIDEEAKAWLVGHITGTLYKFLDKKKLQVKHG